jgi:hypothetical protein
VTDAHEASGQYVGQKAAKKLLYRQSHLALLVAMSVILPTEGDFLSVKGNQSVVGDRHPVGVSAEVSEHLGRPAEGRLGVDDPVGPVERSQKSGKAFLWGEFPQLSGEPQEVLPKSFPQPGEELAAEDPAEHLDREKERVTWSNPVGVIRRQSAGGDDAVYMRVMPTQCI